MTVYVAFAVLKTLVVREKKLEESLVLKARSTREDTIIELMVTIKIFSSEIET